MLLICLVANRLGKRSSIGSGGRRPARGRRGRVVRLRRVVHRRATRPAYFSPLTRAWELALGALRRVPGPAADEGAATRAGRGCRWVGLVAVLRAAVVYDESAPFPGSRPPCPSSAPPCCWSAA